MWSDPTREGDMTKIAMKAMIAATAACTVAAPAFAYTLTGTIPAFSAPPKPPNTGMAQVHLQPAPAGYVKLTVTIPQALSLGIGYGVTFCVGPTPTSCGPNTPNIPSGHQIVVYYDAVRPVSYVVWLGQGTAAAVPYVIEVDYGP
jgi:hypothetical protein